MERLHKFLARAGVDSRRACEELMLAGRVSVNGRVQRELGTQIDPDVDDIRLDGEPVKAPTELHYVLLHKPRGVITSMSDPEGRPTVADLVQTESRLFPVGRLDFDSEGLLLLTDDGDLAYKLTHPSFEVEKEYHALLNMAPNLEQLRQWREGIELEEGRTAPAWVEALEETPDGVWVRVVIHEGRNRQVRRVAENLGLEVKRLVRMREGPLILENLGLGKWRPLTEAEIINLRMHAKRSKAWLPTRPLPESPQDENPQERPRTMHSSQFQRPRDESARERPRMQRIDRSGQPVRSQDDSRGGPPRMSSEGGSRPLRRRGEPAELSENPAEDTAAAPPSNAEASQPLRRREEGGDRGPRRDDNRGGPPRDGARSFDRGPRRDDDRSFDRGPRRDDDRGGPPRDGARGFDRGPRRDDDRGGPPRDGARGFDRGPRRDDDRGGPPRDGARGFDRGPRRDDRPVRLHGKIDPAEHEAKKRPWERSQTGGRPDQESGAPAETAPRAERPAPQVEQPAPQVERPQAQPSAPRERTNTTESTPATRRPWTKMGGRGITGRSRTNTSGGRKSKGDADE